MEGRRYRDRDDFMKGLDRGEDINVELRNRLKEDGRAKKGFSMLQGILTHEDIRSLKKFLPGFTLGPFLCTENGESLSRVTGDHKKLAFSVKELSKKLERLETAGDNTQVLIGEVLPILDEIEIQLDPKHPDLTSDIDFGLYYNLKKKATSNTLRTYAIRAVFKKIEYYANRLRIDAIAGGTPPAEWPPIVKVSPPPCEAIALIVTALLGLDKEISSSRVSDALKLKKL